jgi:hypothetical protein
MLKIIENIYVIMFVLITQSPVCGVFAKSRKVTISLVMSVCLSVRPSVCLSAQNLAPTGRIFIIFDIWVFSEIFEENSSFGKTWLEVKGILHEYLCAFTIESHCIILIT